MASDAEHLSTCLWALSMSSLEQDNMKHNNMHIIGIPEGEEEEQGIENLFKKIMMENFLM